MSNLEKYHDVLKKQDQNINFYLRHRVRLLQLLGDLKDGKLASIDPINDTFINLEKRKLALSQHLVDLDMDYSQILNEEDKNEDEVVILEERSEKLKNKISRINRFKSDLNMINKVISSELQQDSINISKTKIEELFKLENDEEYQLIFRKGDLIDATNEIYKFNKIEFHKNLKELGDLLKKEKQNCDDLKNKIENDRLQWTIKQKNFVQLYTS